MTKQTKAKITKEKDNFFKCDATFESGNGSMIVVDKVGLALLLITIYKQELLGVDWTQERGELFKFEDNPIARACVAIWRSDEGAAEGGNQSMTVAELFLFNLLGLSEHDAFFHIETIEQEKRMWAEEVRQKYGLLETENAHNVTNKGDI